MKGTMGDITFYKTKDGYVAKEKSDIGDKLKTSPQFERTRENNSEFGRAGKAVKLLRNAFRLLLQNSADTRMTSRLQKEMMKVLKADPTSMRGQRNVADGDPSLLLGFEFNLYSPFSSTFFEPFTSVIERATGKLNVSIPAFDPRKMIAAPVGATHAKIVSGGASIDFGAGTYEFAQSSADPIDLSEGMTADMELSNGVTANSTHPLFLMLGIEFYQEVNGSMYPLKNGAFNALSLVAVSTI